MSQNDALEIIKSHPEQKFGIRQISQALNISLTSASSNLRKLHRSGLVKKEEYRPEGHRQTTYYYRCQP